MPSSQTVKRRPGKTRTFLDVGRFAQGVRCRLPVLTLTGAKPGPMLLVTAAQHGRELNGIASIAKAFDTLAPEEVAGTVVFLPVLNPVAVRIHRQDYPIESYRSRRIDITQNYNMNRAWTEEPQDTLSSATAECVSDTYIKHADALVDFHGWSNFSVSLVMAYRSDKAFARNFGLPHFLLIPDNQKGSTMRYAAKAAGIGGLTVELASQNRVYPEKFAEGYRGILNTMKHFSMMKGELALPPAQYEMHKKRRKTLFLAEHEGLVVTEKSIGQWVKRGETVARLLSLDSLEITQEFKAEFDGVLYHIGGTNEGEDTVDTSLLHPGQLVGCVEEVHKVYSNGEAPQ